MWEATASGKRPGAEDMEEQPFPHLLYDEWKLNAKNKNI